MTKYKIRTGMNLKNGKRLEPGDTYTGQLPKWVVDQGHAVKVEKKKAGS